MKHCKVCGAEYELCYSCEKKYSWKVHTDTAEHYYIFGVLMEYQVSHNTKQAYSSLRKRGINLRDTAGFTPSVQKILAEIDALAHENSRAKKADVKAESVNAEDTANNEAAGQQEQEMRGG